MASNRGLIYLLDIFFWWWCGEQRHRISSTGSLLKYLPMLTAGLGKVERRAHILHIFDINSRNSSTWAIICCLSPRTYCSTKLESGADQSPPALRCRCPNQDFNCWAKCLPSNRMQLQVVHLANIWTTVYITLHACANKVLWFSKE